MNVALDLKSLTNRNAGISRYCINLTSHLLKRNKYQYFGIMGPESDDTLKKIGSVWSCYKYKEHIKTVNFKVAGSRSENREETAKTVIINLYDFINEL